MQSSQPLVSVVIACYNHEQFVQDAIQSVIDQIYNNIELIIIDDGSKDSSVAKIKEMIELCKRRFTRFEFRSRANIGLSATLNEALEWCQGKYYSPFASDDEMLPNKTAYQVNYLEKNKEVIAVFGAVELIDCEGNRIGAISPSNRRLSFKNIILSNYTIMAPTQMIRTEVIKGLGENPYPSHIKIEDWYMWLKLAEIGTLKNIPNELVRYRIHDNNTMRNIESINNAKKYVLKEFSNNYFYQRALRLVQVTNYIAMNRKLPNISLIKENPKLLLDVIFYKKIFQFLINKI